MSDAGGQPAQGPQAPDPITIPSSFLDGDGRPRFAISVPRAALNDAGVKVLAYDEARRGGYEYPSRKFIDVHLRPGDLFIDIGAHWGVFALHAATRYRGDVHVLAVEPHPVNVSHLIRWVAGNRLADAVEIIAAAVGPDVGTAPLVFNTTMGHSLFGLGHSSNAPNMGAVTVPVMTIDHLFAERSDIAGRRTILKIDAEGYEPEVLAGARNLLDSGRVAALIWEHGRAFHEGERREAMLAMCGDLEARGFRQYRFPHPTMGGTLVPFAPTSESFNVFAMVAGERPLPTYIKPDPRPEVLPAPCRSPDDPEVRAASTTILIERKATDAARWADFEAMSQGADERAHLAAAVIAPESRVLDLGAGSMALRGVLPAGCRYTPADLVQFAPDTIVVDLNAGGFPDGVFDVVAMIDVVEFLHDPGAVLTAAGRAAPRLVVSYRPADGKKAEKRRRAGLFNDFSEKSFGALLTNASWRVADRRAGAGLTLFLCERA